MVDDCVVQNLVTKLIALSLKYTNVWVLLVASGMPGRFVGT